MFVVWFFWNVAFHILELLVWLFFRIRNNHHSAILIFEHQRKFSHWCYFWFHTCSRTWHVFRKNAVVGNRTLFFCLWDRGFNHINYYRKIIVRFIRELSWQDLNLFFPQTGVCYRYTTWRDTKHFAMPHGSLFGKEIRPFVLLRVGFEPTFSTGKVVAHDTLMLSAVAVLEAGRFVRETKPFNSPIRIWTCSSPLEWGVLPLHYKTYRLAAANRIVIERRSDLIIAETGFEPVISWLWATRGQPDSSILQWPHPATIRVLMDESHGF